MPTFPYTLPNGCDPGALQKLLITNGFVFGSSGGISYDFGTKIATIVLDPSETKDPSSVVATYVYVPYVPPNYPQLYADAQATVNTALTNLSNALAQYNTANTSLGNALTAYNTAASNYSTGLTAWNAAGTPVTSGNAVAHVQPAQNEAIALASACQAFLSAHQAQGSINSAFLLSFNAVVSDINAIVNVLNVLAQRVDILEED